MMEQSMQSAKEIAGAIGRGILDIRRGVIEVRRGVSGVIDRAGNAEEKVERAFRDTQKSFRSTTKLARKSGQRLLRDAEKHVWRPAEKSLTDFVREVTGKKKKRVPTWAKFAIGGLGVGITIYGLSRSQTVRNVVRPVTEPLGDLVDAAGDTLKSLAAEL